MYIIDGIAYAGDLEPTIRVSGVRPLKDFKPLLEYPGFAPLKDVEIFNSVYIDYGATVWQNGNIDIDPFELYSNGISSETVDIA